MRHLHSLEHLAAIAALARSGSPVAAARLRRCAPSSIYRAVERLEADVGQPLFVRSSGRWTPTRAGDEIVQLAERLRAEIAATELSLAGAARSTPTLLRVSASDGLAGWFLPNVLAAFTRAHAGVGVELLSDNQFADLAHHEADIAIRPDQRPGDDLVGRRAGKLAHALYGADALLARRGMPRTPADLADYGLCVLSESLSHFTAFRWAQRIAADAGGHALLRFNTETAMANAIAAGAGVGVLPCFIGGALHGVRRIGTFAIAEPVDIWLVTHQALRRNVHVRALLHHLAAAFKRDAASFA